MRFDLSIWVESEDSAQVLKSSQNVDMKTRLDNQSHWYYVDKEKFDDSEEVLNEFHKLYSNKSRYISK